MFDMLGSFISDRKMGNGSALAQHLIKPVIGVSLMSAVSDWDLAIQILN
jgi:hypothetical protein